MNGSGNDPNIDTVRVGPHALEGFLAVPESATGLVVFVHGAGSSRHSVRNNFVAGKLRDVGLATLLFDLLSESEAADRRNVFDIPLLTDRLVETLQWVEAREPLRDLPVGLFGSSTGAAAALFAAAQLPEHVACVVSRGGRPDLAGTVLDGVTCPTLLIVGGADIQVLELNEQALNAMRCRKKLTVVPGATHLFEEPGALEKVAETAAAWFREHLYRPTTRNNERVLQD